MKTLVILFSVLFLNLTQVDAQTGDIKGKLVNDDKQPLAFASVSLFLVADSSLLKVVVTTQSGDFIFENRNKDNYYINFSMVGYETKIISVNLKEMTSLDWNLGELPVKKMPQSLTNHTVVSKKPMIEVKADKLVFNVESSINATGSDAFELLRKSPGVQVDNNDNILLKGKSGVRIYIDGKLSQLDSKALASFLKGINSADIEAIEMITNPSAKFDASGNSGIINIRLKKNKKYGTNGNVNAGFTQGITPKINEALSLNYRNKKINIFGNFGHSKGIWSNDLDLNRMQLDTIYDLKSTHRHDRNNYNYKVGADWFIDARSTLGVISTMNNQDEMGYAIGRTPIYFAPSNQFVKTLIANTEGEGHNLNLNQNINYRYSDTSGVEVNVDADYGSFRGRGSAYQPNYYQNASGALLYQVINRNNTPINISIYTIKADVEHNWGKKSKIGYGWKSSLVKTDNTFDFFTEDANGFPVKILSRSNSFTYTENVNALYANFKQTINAKWSWQAGLRTEQTRSRGELVRADGTIQDGDDVKKQYINLFPSGAISYNINDKNTLNLTFSRRIDRPSYQDLNPFENKLDELTYQKGNAFLNPQYSNNVEFSHVFMGALTTTISYGHISDFATEVTDTLSNATYVQQKNIATMDNWGINIGSATPFTKWWSGYVSFWYNVNALKGEIGTNALSERVPNYGAYWQQGFNLGKEFSAEISGWYSGPSFWGATWKTSSQWQMDLGLQKNLFNKNLTVKLSATDIFFTSPWKANNDFGGLKVNGGGNWESRTFRVNLNWKFGSAQIKAARERATGLETETKRIKGAQ